MPTPEYPPKKKKRIVQNSKYMGMAYQLFALLAITIFIGIKADAYFGNETQYITAISAFVILLLYFYKLYITLNNTK